MKVYSFSEFKEKIQCGPKHFVCSEHTHNLIGLDIIFRFLNWSQEWLGFFV